MALEFPQAIRTKLQSLLDLDDSATGFADAVGALLKLLILDKGDAPNPWGSAAFEDRGGASGVAPLDADSRVPAANLPAASDSAAGIVEFATSAEAIAGTAAALATPPAALRAVVGSQATSKEISDGSVTAVRRWSPADVASAASAHGTPAPVQTLPAAAAIGDIVPYDGATLRSDDRLETLAVRLPSGLSTFKPYVFGLALDSSGRPTIAVRKSDGHVALRTIGAAGWISAAGPVNESRLLYAFGGAASGAMAVAVDWPGLGSGIYVRSAAGAWGSAIPFPTGETPDVVCLDSNGDVVAGDNSANKIRTRSNGVWSAGFGGPAGTISWESIAIESDGSILLLARESSGDQRRGIWTRAAGAWAAIRPLASSFRAFSPYGLAIGSGDARYLISGPAETGGFLRRYRFAANGNYPYRRGWAIKRTATRWDDFG